MNVPSQLLFATLVFIGSLLCIGFIIGGLNNRRHNASKSFVGVMLFAFLYSFFYGLELVVFEREQKQMFLLLQYSGALFIAPQFWWFTRSYASKQQNRFFPPWYIFIFPVVLLVLVFWENQLQLFYTNYSLVSHPDGSEYLVYDNGVLFYVHNAYALLFVLASVYQLVVLHMTVPEHFKNQVLSISLGFGISILGFLLALSDVFPLYVDPVPISFVICGAILFYSIDKLEFLKKQPIAFEMLFETLTDAVFVFGKMGEVLHKNRSATELLKEMDFSGSDLVKLFSTEGLKAADSNAYLNKDSQELFIKGRWFRLKQNTIVNKGIEEGELIVMRDISQRKINEIAIDNANKKLEQSEKEFRLLVENSRDLIFKLNPLGKITYLSPAFSKLFEKSPSSILNTPFFDLIYPPDQFKVKDALLHLITSTESSFSTLNYRIQKASDTLCWHQTDFVTERNASGTVVHVFGTSKDITANKNAETALIQSERAAKKLALQYETVINNQSVYFVKLDSLGSITYANPFFVNEMNNESDCLKEPFVQVLKASNQDAVEEALAFCVATPKKPKVLITRVENDVTLLKGVKWELRGIPNHFNKVVEIFAVGVDVTEQLHNLERAEKLLNITEKQNERLRSFAYIVSHNIRSHSSNLSGLLQLAARKNTSEKEQLALLPLLKTTADRLEETLQNLNEVLTVQGDLNKQKTAKKLRLAIVNTLDILQNDLREAPVAVSLEVDESLEVEVIPAYLDSVLLNVLSNAIRYRSRERSATINITCASNPVESTVTLAIADNGIGIDVPRYKEKLFGLYKTFHGNPEARGVGLFLVKAQMEAMGGTISVDSTVDQGTTFFMTFSVNGE
ncbi:MAG: PAS domain S-box protein [Schleiferiaceae bacterium]|nr:PAS domain S-box protein [Schleiferiaceae bacterium]